MPFGEAAEESVEAFGSARGEKNFFGFNVKVGGDEGAGVLQKFFGSLAERVDARGIRRRAAQIDEHRLQYLRVERRRSVVV